MKIELQNKTRFRDDDLRAIIKGACRQAGVALGRVKVTVTHSRGSEVTGYAYYPPALPRELLGRYTGKMRLCIPKPGVAPSHGSVAQVALHEAMHLCGVAHKDMTEEQYYSRMPTPWADDLPLRVREETPAEERKAAARADRAAHARRMLAKAETRLKRATTIAKKWRRRVAASAR